MPSSDRTNGYIIFVLVATILYASGCTRAEAPVISKTDRQTDAAKVRPAAKPATQQKQISESGYHIIAKGDTLYSIAWRYDLDYLDLAAWNAISEPYTIYPGQVLRLKPLPEWSKTQSPQPEQKTPAAATPNVPEKKVATVKQSVRKLPKGPVKWVWPASGRVVKLDSPTSKQGIDIAGKHGQVIKTSAPGKVVYSDSGLLGYGKLIIIKHNQTYLSAYAYNSELLVKEGDNVSAGQEISKMGRPHNSDRALLHFEIRKSGKPVDPLDYLPKKA